MHESAMFAGKSNIFGKSLCCPSTDLLLFYILLIYRLLFDAKRTDMLRRMRRSIPSSHAMPRRIQITSSRC